MSMAQTSLGARRVDQLRPKRSSKVQFFFAGLLLLVAPLSGSSESTTTIKLVRIGLSVAMVVGCLTHFSRARVGKISRGLVGIACFYTLAAIWSNDPAYGLLHKGMFLASCVAGVVLAASLNGIVDLRDGLRTMLPFIAIGAVAIILVALTDESGNYVMGRLAAFKINANALGQSAAAMLILCLSHMVIDRSKWKFLSGISSVLLIWIIIETGSRGSVLMAVAGGGLIFVGAVKGLAQNIGLLIVLGMLLLPAMVLVGSELATDIAPATGFQREWSSGGGGRMQREMLKDTRTQMWAQCFKEWERSPIIGVGWFSQKHRSRSTMNMYLQVLVECGEIGFVLFMIWLAMLGKQCIRLIGKVGNWPRDYRVCAWLSFGCVIGLLIHGLAESSILLGTTVNPLLLGFSVVMLERIPAMLGMSFTRGPA